MILKKVNTLKATDRGFPETLSQTIPPVKELHWLGSNPAEWLSRPRVAVVGSRKVSAYGKFVTEELVRKLAARGVVIISGLALGVDSLAHRTALKYGGLTVAVLPTALDNIYPPSNLDLARQIVSSGGSLLSEYQSDSPVYKHNFIVRNRIVCGLADVLVITEATRKSGTMHTARFALEAGITVMAVPGNINSPGSDGANNLIKSGAIPVTDVDDILFGLGLGPSQPHTHSQMPLLGDRQKAVLRLIENGQSDQDDLASETNLNSAQLNSILTELEIAGIIRPTGGGNWIAAKG